LGVILEAKMDFVFVNVDAANLYKEASFKSAIDSQVVLWEKLKLIEKGNQFSRVSCEDGYIGWVNNHQFCKTASPKNQFKTVTKNHNYIHENPDTSSQIIREVGAGSSMPFEQIDDEWVKTLLPDGKTGWLLDNSFNEINGDKRKNLIQLSKQFLGVPYFWGGKSPKGLDCSGYVQLLSKLVGLSIRRDSPMQFEDASMVSEDLLAGQPGDLLFFAENGNRITHVGVKLSDNKIIHVRGMVRINSLLPGEADYDKSLIENFVAVKTYF
jgi:cell wall-associated NlpC family hydrolase